MAIVTSTNNVKNLGDKIPCRYTALASGQVGYFSELGNTTATVIPVTSSPTPNGAFYWVYVGKDYLGRKKFIADRNIQHSISWDSLNNSGICTEKIIDLGLGNKYKTSIRLLTGGTSSTDLDNEWDKIIASSTLGGTIIPSDNNVWNWGGISSWASTTVSGTNTNRPHRGNTAVNTYYSNVSSYVGNTIGFRPVLLIESPNNKFLIKKDSNYYSVKSEYYDEINHVFTPLILAGGTEPNKLDIETYGFDDLNLLSQSITKGTDTFKPIDKLDNIIEVKCYNAI